MKVKKGDIIRDIYGGRGKVINFYSYDKTNLTNEYNTVVEYECSETFMSQRVLQSEIVEVING